MGHRSKSKRMNQIKTYGTALIWILGISLISGVSYGLETSGFSTGNSVSSVEEFGQKGVLKKLVDIEDKIEFMKNEIMKSQEKSQRVMASNCISIRQSDSFRVKELEVKVYQIRNLHNDIMFSEDASEISRLERQADGILRAAEGICRPPAQSQAELRSHEKLITEGSY